MDSIPHSLILRFSDVTYGPTTTILFKYADDSLVAMDDVYSNNRTPGDLNYLSSIRDSLSLKWNILKSAERGNFKDEAVLARRGNFRLEVVLKCFFM